MTLDYVMAKATKEKVDELDFLKIKNFCPAKETIKKVKRQSPEQQEIFANHKSNNGPYGEYINNSHNSIIKR